MYITVWQTGSTRDLVQIEVETLLVRCCYVRLKFTSISLVSGPSYNQFDQFVENSCAIAFRPLASPRNSLRKLVLLSC